MEAWSEDFNPMEKAVIQSLPQTWGRPKSIAPDVQERHWPIRLQATYRKRGRTPSCPCRWCWTLAQHPILNSSMERSSSLNSLRLAKQPRSFIASKDSATITLSCPNRPWSHRATSSCMLLAQRRQIFHLALVVMLPRESCRVEMRDHHHRRDIDSESQAHVLPDLCSPQAKWYRFSLMPNRMRSDDWAWWGGLAEDREMGSG